MVEDCVQFVHLYALEPGQKALVNEAMTRRVPEMSLRGSRQPLYTQYGERNPLADHLNRLHI